MPRFAWVLVLLTLLFLLPQNAMAAGRRRYAGSSNASALRSQANYERASATNYRGGYEQYPKFIGGFHYHDLHNIGIPNGDIGLRGNGISMSPW